MLHRDLTGADLHITKLHATTHLPTGTDPLPLIPGPKGDTGAAGTADYTALSNKPTLGTASPLDVPAGGDASTTQVVKGNDTRLSDTRRPLNASVTLAKMADMATASLIYRKTASAGVPEVQTLATLKTDLDSMPASDVSAWAKNATKPAYASSEISNISAAGQELINDANAAAQRVTLGTAAYSEGTWTPVLNGFTVVGAAPAVSGNWKRIGNLMFADCAISAGVGGNTSVACTVNASTISGLPAGTGLQLPCFTIDNWDNNLGIGIVSNTSMLPATFSANVHTIIVSATYITS